MLDFMSLNVALLPSVEGLITHGLSPLKHSYIHLYIKHLSCKLNRTIALLKLDRDSISLSLYSPVIISDNNQFSGSLADAIKEAKELRCLFIVESDEKDLIESLPKSTLLSDVSKFDDVYYFINNISIDLANKLKIELRTDQVVTHSSLKKDFLPYGKTTEVNFWSNQETINKTIFYKRIFYSQLHFSLEYILKKLKDSGLLEKNTMKEIDYRSEEHKQSLLVNHSNNDLSIDKILDRFPTDRKQQFLEEVVKQQLELNKKYQESIIDDGIERRAGATVAAITESFNSRGLTAVVVEKTINSKSGNFRITNRQINCNSSNSGCLPLLGFGIFVFILIRVFIHVADHYTL